MAGPRTTLRLFVAVVAVLMISNLAARPGSASAHMLAAKLAPHHRVETVTRVRGYRIGPGARLRHARLAHADLRGADLARADLVGADLIGANLSHANLSGADLARARLKRANLAGVKARGVRGTPKSLPQYWVVRSGFLLGPRINLYRAALAGVYLNGVDLEKARVTEADLAGASLHRAILNGAQLLGADVSRANLTDAGLANANLESANAAHATLTGASLVHARVSGTNFTGADLDGAVVANADLTRATLTGARSSGLAVAPSALPPGWSRTDGYLVGPGADLDGANLTGADLHGRNLAQSDFAYATLSGANLHHADLSNSDLANATLTSADLSDATLTGDDLANAGLSSANLSGVTAGGISGSPSSLPADWELTGGKLQQLSSALTGTEYFYQGQWIESSNGEFTVDMQTDGNMVEYQNGTAIWATGTSGNDFGVMQGDCNFVIYNAANTAIYTTGTGGDDTTCTFTVNPDGSLVVATAAGTVRWERYANGTIYTHRITMTSNAPLLSAPTTASSQIGTIPSGDSPQYVCWTTGPPVGSVNVYFYVLWDGTAGYYPSYYDSSVYSSDSRISIDYGIPACGSVPTTFTPPSSGATGTPAPSTIAAPITVTAAAPVDSSPGSGQISSMPAGTRPGFICWATGPSVDAVNVWFKVYWLGNDGYYPSGLDNSTYTTDSQITSKYSIPSCGGSNSGGSNGGGTSGGGGSGGGGTGSGGGTSAGTGHAGGTVTGQAILNAATQWIGKTSYCWDAGNEDGPTHGAGDFEGEAPDCTQSSTAGFDCSGLAIYAIFAAGGPDLFAKAHGRNLEDYGTAVSLNVALWQVGDIISFDSGRHFAIYAGGGYVVQADTAVHFTGGGWNDGVSRIPLRWLRADLSVTTVRRFS